jgi:hypothetical protein
LRATIVLRLVFGVVVLGGLGFIYGGITGIRHREHGRKTTASVLECHDTGGKYSSSVCTGTWATGNLAGSGRVVTGTIDGASQGDEGKSLAVRVSGDHAFTPSLRSSVVIVALGVLMALGGLFLIVRVKPQPRA